MKKSLFPPLICLLLLFTAFSCSGDSNADGQVGGPLTCPEPAELPFAVESSAFLHPARAAEAQAGGPPRHVLYDYIGHAGETQTLSGITNYGGTLTINPLPGEYVSLWTRDEEERWWRLGRVETDSEGNFSAEIPADRAFGAGAHRVYVVVEGDRTCSQGGVFIYPPGTRMIVSDIDGTITVDDAEMYMQMEDPDYVALAYAGAVEMFNLYAAKGYEIVYLTARPYNLRSLTRIWLDTIGAPFGYVQTASTLVAGETARAYKGDFVLGLINDKGYEVSVAYGNAESDQLAYMDAGLPEDRVFIIGPEAGTYGTILYNDYTEHITTFVQDFPAAGE